MYKQQYFESYHQIKLTEMFVCTEQKEKNEIPHWATVTNFETLKNIENKYNINLGNIDFDKSMVIVSYGAKLEYLDYNSMESTFKTRNCYIGFPIFSNSQPDIIYFYIADYVPIIDTDVAGYSPDYKGKYR